MFDNQMRFRIKKLLKETYPNLLKQKEIAAILHINKHKRKDLIHTLSRMVKNEEIYRNHRYFSIKALPENKTLIGRFDGRPLARNQSYAFVLLENNEDCFISSEDIKNAYDGDLVEIDIKYNKKGKSFGTVTKIIERKHKKIVGTIEKYQGKTLLIPDNSRLHTDFYVNDSKNSKPGDKVIIEIINWGDPLRYRLPIGNVIEILGRSGDPKVELLSVIKHYDLPLDFPNAVRIEADNLVKEKYHIDDDKRLNHKDLTTITIDPESAKDYDDAISLEVTDDGYKLYVHIADVAEFVSLDSHIFEEAVARGNSYYFPKKVIPMLPEVLSNGLCSLRPNEEKLTLSVVSDISKDGRILKQNVYESIIESDIRLTYKEVDDFFENRKSNISEDIKEKLNQMRVLSALLSRKRILNGYLNFNLPETIFIFDDNGEITDISRSEETESHKIIENFMLVANEFIAKYLGNSTTIFRIHEKPEIEKIENLKEIVKYYDLNLELSKDLNKSLQNLLASFTTDEQHRVFDRFILRSLKRAKYSTVNFGHFGLGIQHYTHFTSPIRRLSDLIIHHQVKKRLNNIKIKNDKLSNTNLKDYAKIATEKEMIADESEREVDLKNKNAFMRKHLGEEFDAVIVSAKSSALIVELDALPITGIIELSSIKDDYYEFSEKYFRVIGRRKGIIFKLTDKVRVRLEKIDDDIYFTMI